MILTQLFETVLRDKEDLQAKRKTLQDLSMNKDVDQKVVQQRKLDLEREAERKGLAESAEGLNIGDPVEITGNVEYNGATGEIVDIGRNGSFVVVDLYNHGRHSFHASDVTYNEYADKQDSDEFWDEEEVDEGWSDKYGGVMRPPTPYSVYIKGKKWKDFATDDHARAVMDKLKAKFKADGRDPETVTIAPTDIPEGVAEDDGSQLEKAVADAPVEPIANMEEAKSLKKRVRVVKTGETGTIRQIKHGAFKGAAKTYYVDLDNGGQADNLPASALRLLKDQTVEATEKTATGLRHRARPGVYGGAEREADPLRTLDKPGTNKIEKALGVKFDREKRYQGGINLREQSSPVENAILHRIMVAHSDVLGKHGPQAVMDAASDVADFVGEVDEIGSSDVSAWVKQTIETLEGRREVDEVSKDTLGRYIKLAGVDAADRASSSSYQSGAAGDKYNKADTGRQEQNRERGIDRAITRLTR
jgi:hypothetical protein